MYMLDDVFVVDVMMSILAQCWCGCSSGFVRGKLACLQAIS